MDNIYGVENGDLGSSTVVGFVGARYVVEFLAMVDLVMVNDEARLLFSTLQVVCFLINFLHLDCILLDLLITLVLCICVHVLVVYSS